MIDMNRTYDFATIGFRPYPETGEFVTIGVIAVNTMGGEMGYRLIDKNRSERIKHMFPNFSPELYETIWDKLDGKLLHAKYATMAENENVPIPISQGWFNALTTSRDGMFSYPVKGRWIAPSLKDVLGELNDRYLDQSSMPKLAL